jgi:hypothetical protein
MKNKSFVALFLALLLGLCAQLAALAQGTAFTYQGLLSAGASPANGNYDLRFALFDAPTVGNQIGSLVTNSSVNVSNGLFTVTTDFAANFPGANRWLEISVRTNGGVSFTTLAPRQQLTPAPYAIFAGTVSTNGLAPGAYSSAVNFNNAANSFSGSGANLTSVNASFLGGLGASSFWNLGGNSGTGGAFLGTMDAQPLELVAGSARVLRLETTVETAGGFDIVLSVNTLGGALGNVISNGVVGGTIAGGGNKHFFTTEAAPNSVYDNFGTVGGGLNNTAGSADGFPTNSRAATVSGGEYNLAYGDHSVVGGGATNTAGSTNSVVSGGMGNGIFDGTFGIGGIPATAVAFTAGSAIDGGENNAILAYYDTFFNFPTTLYHCFDSAIGGGLSNTISGASYATIPGGRNNSVNGSYGLAAGYRAKANHTGTFVWADTTDADFASTGAGQFLIRASGGVGINKTNPAATLDVNGTSRIQGANNWDVNNTEGDFRVGNDLYRFKIGVANGGGGSGDVWMRAHGGTARLFVKTPGGTTFYSNEGQTSGVSLAAGGGSWANLSDRNAKENFTAIDAQEILQRVASLSLTSWNYKSQEKNIRHIGPMAQDFYAAFSMGEDDHHITTVDADGVALAAIQGLNEKMQQLKNELKLRDTENAELKARLERLEKLVEKN